MRVDLVALDGDQPCTGIRRADADLDVFAGVHILAFECQLQFGVAIQRACDVTGTSDAEFNAVLLHTVGIADTVEKSAGRTGIQRQFKATNRYCQCAFLDRDFFRFGFVLICAVWLLQQHRNKATLYQFQLQIIHRNPRSLRIDDDQVDGARRATRHEAHVTISLKAHQVWQFRHEHRRICRNATATLRLKSTGQEMQAIGGARIAVQAEFEYRIAVVIGRALGQFVRIALFGAQRIVEAMIGIAAEGRVGGLQCQRAFDTPVGGRCAEQILHIDLALQFTG